MKKQILVSSLLLLSSQFTWAETKWFHCTFNTIEAAYKNSDREWERDDDASFELPYKVIFEYDSVLRKIVKAVNLRNSYLQVLDNDRCSLEESTLSCEGDIRDNKGVVMYSTTVTINRIDLSATAYRRDPRVRMRFENGKCEIKDGSLKRVF